MKKNNWRKLGINKPPIGTEFPWNLNQFSYTMQNPEDTIPINKKLMHLMKYSPPKSILLYNLKIKIRN